jgi:hypothetical protein
MEASAQQSERLKLVSILFATRTTAVFYTCLERAADTGG